MLHWLDPPNNSDTDSDKMSPSHTHNTITNVKSPLQGVSKEHVQEEEDVLSLSEPESLTTIDMAKMNLSPIESSCVTASIKCNDEKATVKVPVSELDIKMLMKAMENHLYHFL